MLLDKFAYERSNYLPQHEKLTEQIAEMTKWYESRKLSPLQTDQIRVVLEISGADHMIRRKGIKDAALGLLKTHPVIINQALGEIAGLVQFGVDWKAESQDDLYFRTAADIDDFIGAFAARAIGDWGPDDQQAIIDYRDKSLVDVDGSPITEEIVAARLSALRAQIAEDTLKSLVTDGKVSSILRDILVTHGIFTMDSFKHSDSVPHIAEGEDIRTAIAKLDLVIKGAGSTKRRVMLRNLCDKLWTRCELTDGSDTPTLSEPLPVGTAASHAALVDQEVVPTPIARSDIPKPVEVDDDDLNSVVSYLAPSQSIAGMF